MTDTLDEPILLASDLDRTLIPNGEQPESPQARPLLRQVAQQPALVLAYVSGRHLALVEAAVREWQLPVPRYAVCDVGTSIYRRGPQGWVVDEGWYAQIEPDWGGHDREALAGMLAGVDGIELQEPEKQGRCKLSYYTPPTIDRAGLCREVADRLAAHGIRANVIWSLDETVPIGLLDVLPRSADKLHAVRFLMAETGVSPARFMFAGDSGNDLQVLTSGLQSVLVANAHPDVKAAALAGGNPSLYLARGGLLGMNGNYAAGVLEGLAHFFPETRQWLG